MFLIVVSLSMLTSKNNTADMKKFILRILMFAVMITTIDFCFGYAMDYMHDHSKGGGMAKRLYMARESVDEIILFGSSRMNHHYNPIILEDSLGLSCFNAGQDGNGIIMSYGFLEMMLKRYNPRLIVYDISEFDFAVGDNMKYISLLKPYYSEPSVKDIITDISPMDKYKMMCSMYKYNSLVVRVLGSYISSSSEYQKGYLPLLGTMDYEVDDPVECAPMVDSVKIKYLRKFVELCKAKNVELVFSLSPRYKAKDSSYYKEVKDMILKMNVPFLDNYSNPDFCNNIDLFQDQIHMNSKGADEFTRYLIPYLREYIN